LNVREVKHTEMYAIFYYKKIYLLQGRRLYRQNRREKSIKK